MPARRELLAALGVCLLGALLALVASVPTWVRVAVPRVRPLADAVVTVSGRDLAPLVPALGLVGLAAVVGLVATRGRGRSALGVVLAGCGIAVVLAAGPHLVAPSPPTAAVLVAGPGPLPGRDMSRPVEPQAEPVWPAFALVGGLLLAAAGTVSVVRGRRWPAMSGRYDAPAASPDSHPAAPGGPPAPTPQASPGPPADTGPPASPARPAPQRLWDALDRGDDPTA
jgi:Tryptophan-associated transmembrane protein (Trp_oprn_chp)